MTPLERRLRLLFGLDFPSVEPPPETEGETRVRILQEALSTVDGRYRLAQAMSEPFFQALRSRLRSRGNLRSMFQVEPLPEGSPGTPLIYQERYEHSVHEFVERYLTREEHGHPMIEGESSLLDDNRPFVPLPSDAPEYNQSLENVVRIEDEEFMRALNAAAEAEREWREREDETGR